MHPKNMRILLAMEATGGGTGRHLVDLATGMIRLGHAITIIYSPLRAEPSFVSAVNALPDAEVHALPMRRAVGPKDLIDLSRLTQLVRQIGPFDVLHGHSSKAGALVRLLPKTIPGLRVYTPHAFRTMDPALKGPARHFYAMVERVLAQRTQRIIAVSEQEREHAIGLGIAPRRVAMVPNGIDAPALPSRAEARAKLGLSATSAGPVIGIVGRLTHQKAPERALHALAGSRRDDARLVVIGTGELAPSLLTLAGQLGISRRVAFVGLVDGQSAMPAFDVLLMPSRYESFGYVLLEAAAAGVATLSTPVGFAREIVAMLDRGAIVHNGDDPVLWSSALDRLLDDIDAERRGRTAAKLPRGAPNATQMVEETLAVYTNALSEHRHE